MRKAYCDVCGIECEPGNPKQEEILFTYEDQKGETRCIHLVDMCDTCRDQIGEFIANMITRR